MHFRPYPALPAGASVAAKWFYSNPKTRVAEISSEDGPLSVRIRPSNLKRDCDRRARDTGECAW